MDTILGDTFYYAFILAMVYVMVRLCYVHWLFELIFWKAGPEKYRVRIEQCEGYTRYYPEQGRERFSFNIFSWVPRRVHVWYGFAYPDQVNDRGGQDIMFQEEDGPIAGLKKAENLIAEYVANRAKHNLISTTKKSKSKPMDTTKEQNKLSHIVPADNNLSKGPATHNGHYISYKTRTYSDTHSFAEACYKELCAFLDARGIAYDKSDYYIYHSGNSRSRKGCVTVAVESKDTTLPFDGSSID